jgi:hypothetical protein
MLAAAGMNLKRMINKWKLNSLAFLAQLFKALLGGIKNHFLLKMSF